jgi:hypothetical protein
MLLSLYVHIPYCLVKFFVVRRSHEIFSGRSELEVILMITREEAIRCLEDVTKEIVKLKEALEEGWSDAPAKDPTQAFLEKCGGWEDSRSPEQIVTDIYAARTSSDRGATIFDKESS